MLARIAAHRFLILLLLMGRIIYDFAGSGKDYKTASTWARRLSWDRTHPACLRLPTTILEINAPVCLRHQCRSVISRSKTIRPFLISLERSVAMHRTIRLEDVGRR